MLHFSLILSFVMSRVSSIEEVASSRMCCESIRGSISVHASQSRVGEWVIGLPRKYKMLGPSVGQVILYEK